jgi:hypothetical protein
MRTYQVLAVLVLGWVALATGASASTLLVPSQYLQIQDAMDVAVAGDEIIVAPGVYADTTNFAGLPLDSTKCVVVFKSGVTVRGSGMGQTIIDGMNSARGFHLQDVTNTKIAGLTIRNCYNGWNDVYGAGVFFKNASGSLLNVMFTGNHDGALTCTDGASPQVDWCIMDDNESKSGAGLLVNSNCAPVLYGCRITNNHAPFAAGIHMRGNATLDHCIISGNATTGAGTVLGGGILVIDGADPLIVDCDITDNVCSGNGAGICFVGDGTHGTLEKSMVLDNLSTGVETRGAGVSIESQSAATLRATVVARNHANGEYSDGGGVYVQYSSATIENCTLDANGSAGTYAEAGNLGILTSMFVPGAITVTHTILSHSPDGRGVYCDPLSSGTDPTISCCDIYGNAGGDAPCGTGSENFSADPLLCEPGTDNYSLGVLSPCAPGHHPNGPDACDGLLIGARGIGCSTDVEEPAPVRVRLLGNRPNPFERQTTIALALPEAAAITLDVVDPAGRSIALLHRGPLSAGEHRFTWDGQGADGRGTGSGVFFARVRAGDLTDAIRMLRLQ